MNKVSAPGTPSIDCLLVLVWTHSITACKCITKLARLWSPNSLNDGLQVRTIMASKCIYTLAWSLRPSASPKSFNYGLQVHLQTRSITAFKCISKVARLQLPSSHNHGLEVHLQSRSIMASKCLSKLAQSQPSSVSLNTPNYGCQVHLQTHSIIASQCISESTRLSSSVAPQIALKHCL